MKRFSFSLQKVLEYNTHIQKTEKDRLSFLHSEFEDLKAKRENLLWECETQKNLYNLRAQKGIPASEGAIRLNHIGGIYVRIQHCEGEMREKKRQIEKQVEYLVQVTKEKTKVEKLKKCKLNHFEKEKQKSEEKLMDELLTRPQSAV